MNLHSLKNLLIAFFLISICLVMACSKHKEGKVVISEQEFSIRKDAENSWVIDAKGKVKNTGEVDVKNVTVTGLLQILRRSLYHGCLVCLGL
jgi:hypothetical protein